MYSTTTFDFDATVRTYALENEFVHLTNQIAHTNRLLSTTTTLRLLLSLGFRANLNYKLETRQ